jgi:D-alanyl-D-alanine carboxypeptidase
VPPVRSWLVLVAALACLTLATGAARGASLPPCSYDDQPTFFEGYDHWERTLVDTALRVTPDYVPPDLRPVGDAGVPGVGSVRAFVIPDLAAMETAANQAGAAFAVQSAYRSYTHQEAVFNGWVARSGLDNALLASARAGHSEHQLGLALDFRSPDGPAGWQVPDWATTAPGAWLAEHAWEYGFQMSYPRGASPSETCYQYEPWHYRYVGRGHAQIIHDRAITVRAYLWQFGNDPDQRATPVPSPTLGPSPVPVATPTESVSPTATISAEFTPAPTAPIDPDTTPMDPLIAVSVGVVAAVAGALAVVRTRRRTPTG